jgi:hypothetical protein
MCVTLITLLALVVVERQDDRRRMKKFVEVAETAEDLDDT